MLVGPRSCGKSELLKQMLDILRNNEFPPVYINGRDGSLTSPGVLARRLASATGSWDPTFLKAFIGTVAAVADMFYPKISAGIDKAQAAAAGLVDSRNANPSDILPVLDILLKLCEKVSKPGSRPVFIFDEANVLTEWRQADWQTPLAELLRFFVLVRLCHCDFVQGTRSRTKSLLAQFQRRTGAC